MNYLIDQRKIDKVIDKGILELRKSILSSFEDITIKTLLEKNPYVVTTTSNEENFLDEMFNAWFYSSKETKIGKLLEKIALAIVGEEKKCPAKGIDLDIIKNQIRWLISIKSGSSWGNSQSTKKQGIDFKNAIKTIHLECPTQDVRSMMGICYGKHKMTVDKEYCVNKAVIPPAQS